MLSPRESVRQVDPLGLRDLLGHQRPLGGLLDVQQGHDIILSLADEVSPIEPCLLDLSQGVRGDVGICPHERLQFLVVEILERSGEFAGGLHLLQVLFEFTDLIVLAGQLVGGFLQFALLVVYLLLQCLH